MLKASEGALKREKEDLESQLVRSRLALDAANKEAEDSKNKAKAASANLSSKFKDICLLIWSMGWIERKKCLNSFSRGWIARGGNMGEMGFIFRNV